MRPTPRTDANSYLENETDTVRVVAVDFARTLERELAEAVELLKMCNQCDLQYAIRDCGGAGDNYDAVSVPIRAFLQRVGQAGEAGMGDRFEEKKR